MAAIYEIFKDTNGCYRFWLISGDGELLLTSEAYESREACEKAIASAKRNASTIKRFERKEADNGQRYFILKARDNTRLCRSRLFATTDSLDGVLDIVRRHGPHSPVNDLTTSVH